jgi:hypothetical protein
MARRWDAKGGPEGRGFRVPGSNFVRREQSCVPGIPSHRVAGTMGNRVRFEPEDREVERLARYIMRPPISLEWVKWGGEGVVHYRAKGGHDGRTLPASDAAEGFDPAEAVARVIMHITEHDVVDAILRHLAKAEARSPRGPPGAATLPAIS